MLRRHLPAMTVRPVRASRWLITVLLVAVSLPAAGRRDWYGVGTPVGYADSSLVAAFNFDEGTGLAVEDVSGQDNHGVVSGAAWSTTAKYGKALSFDGVNDMVSIADAASLDLTTAFTLEAWVRPTTTTGWRTVLMKEVPGELAYTLYANSSPARPSTWVRTGGISKSAIGGTRLTANAWTHLAATYDGATLRLHVNGVSAAATAVTGSIQASTDPFRIGGNAVWGEYFKGQIDDVRVYNRVLAAAEIQADMATPVSAVNDTTPPTVAVTAPADGSALAGTITVTATAADDTAVGGVQFYLDGAVLGAEDTTSPYSVSWNTKAAANGAHTLSAGAHDAAGNTAVSGSVSVTVNNPPQLVILQPASGSSVSGTTVPISYTTQGDLAEVNHVHFVLDAGGTLMDMSFDGAYQISGVSSGTHTLNGSLARANHSKIDGSDAVAVTFTTSTPDLTPPSVALTLPAPGATATGLTTVRADAADNVAVAGVQFLLDGSNLGAEDTQPPYEIAWDSRLTADGGHALAARARDGSANNATSPPVDITVSNGGGPAVTGQWSAPFSMPIVAIHQALLPTGKVLMWDAADFTSAPPVLWDPATGAYLNQPQTSTDLFCAGHAMLADGRLLMMGGDTRTVGLGVNDVNVFNPATSTWSTAPGMAYRRWYPTATTLSDGRVFVLSGYDDCYSPSCIVGRPEIFDPATMGWTSMPTADYVIPTYPFLFGLPDGRIISAGSYEGTVDTRVLDLSTGTWTVMDPNPIDAGSAVMYASGKIMKAGKWANSDAPFVAAHGNTYVLDTNQASPSWRSTAAMNFPRAYNMLTLLPDGTTLATGGSRSTDPASAAQAVFEAEVWSPLAETWTPLARSQKPRLYHGTSMLLPDGRVLVAGSGRYGSPEQLNGEVFSPPYLFKGPRPAIASAPAIVQHGRSFFVGTAATDVAAVTMIRIGAMTHSFNSDQRFLDLPFTPGEGGLTVDGPVNVHTAPPGYYLLFLLNSNGVPSIGSFVRVPATTEDTEPPTAPTGLSAAGGLAQTALSWTAATDNVAVSGYRVHRSNTAGFTPADGNLVGQTASTTFVDTGLAAGTHYYRVIARDAADLRSDPSNEAAAVVTSDGEAPTVAITTPVPGATVSGSVTVAAGAADNVAVAGVRFLLDGAALGAEDASAPYAITWNTGTATPGAHQLTAVVRDGSGNTTTSVAIAVTVTSPAPVGLVLAMGFNEGAGTTAADSSGLANGGALSNATWTASGRFGSALTFNGSSSWVTVADANSLDFTTGMTLSAWVRPTSVSGDYRTVMLKERAPGLSYALYGTDGASRPPAGYINTGGSDLAAIGPSNLAVNTWTHLALSYDGATMRLYVNGSLANSRSAAGSIQTSTGALRIGGNGVWGEYFAGSIDEVRAYNRALTQAEIQADLNTPVSGAPATGAWTLSGTISPAATGAGSTVTLAGAASAAVTADAGGNYSFAGLPNGSYTVTPAKSGVTFLPAARSETINGANLASVDFASTTGGDEFTALWPVNGDLDRYHIQLVASPIAATFVPDGNADWFVVMATFKPAGQQ
ncbi:MAG: LamG-like jellyroll fold domain-containing protein [Vicinamibacterales bacterium]|jgi:hypothetical protein